jgi:L-asparaginase type I
MKLSQKDKTTLIFLTVTAVIFIIMTIYITINCPYKKENVVNDKILILYAGETYISPHFLLIKQTMAKLVVNYKNKIGQCDIKEIDNLTGMTPNDWNTIAMEINKVYNQYDAFIIIHNTDTLAYTSSILSFMFENLNKPIILTGFMIPLQNDALSNLLVSLMTASMYKIPEVVVICNNKIHRGCRTTKINARSVDIFATPNYPLLGKFEKKIEMSPEQVLQPPQEPMGLKLVNPKNKVIVIKIFPGITKKYINTIVNNTTVHGVVLETFGIGDVPSNEPFLEAIVYMIKRGIVVVNISQCFIHQVDQTDVTGLLLQKLGVIPGYDMTTEAALTKLYFLLGNVEDHKLYPELMKLNMRGEIIASRKIVK